jgi:predicted metal-dependent HD superfamily phosphohydrolase
MAAPQTLMVKPLDWTTLAPLYGQPQRVYHDLDHIHAILRHIDALNVGEDEKCWLEAVAWLHDAYQDPRAHGQANERRSAALLVGPHGKSFTDRGRALAQSAILATAYPMVDQVGLDPLVGLFLDLDLSNLSESPAEFRRQSMRIAQELLLLELSEAQVMTAQVGFATHMLARAHVYYSSQFAHLESAARANLAWLRDEPELSMA